MNIWELHINEMNAVKSTNYFQCIASSLEKNKLCQTWQYHNSLCMQPNGEMIYAVHLYS